MDVSELKRQHDEIGAVARALAAAVSHDEQREPIAALRWQLARLLMTHLAMEDRIFYPALQRKSDGPAQAVAARFQSEMGGLAQAFSTYMAHWTDHRVVTDWPGFCAATRALLAALTDRIRRENDQLYPLVEDSRQRQKLVG